MKTLIIKSLKTFCVILLMAACHKDEVVQKSNFSFTITNSYYSYWIVLSDQNGNVLDWKSLQPNIAATFSYPTSDSISATLIVKVDSSNYGLFTYTNITAGNYTQYASSQSNQTVTGHHTVIVSNSNDYDVIDMGSQCGHGINNNGTYTVNLCGSSSSLYVCLQKGASTPRYLFKSQIGALDTTVIDSTLYNSLPLTNSNSVSFNEGVNALSIVQGNTNDGQSLLTSLFYSRGFTTVQPIFYPDLNQVESLFKDYSVFLSYYYQSAPYTHYSHSVTATDPSTFKLQETQANLIGVTSATTSKISYQLSGEAVGTFLTLISSPQAEWYIFSNFSNNTEVILPKFPDNLKKEIDFSFLSTMSLSEVGIFGLTGTGNYNDFYKTQLLVPSSGVSVYPNKSYSVKPDGTIGSN